MTAAVADLRWCLEQALSRHPDDDAAAMALADRMAAFINPGQVTISATVVPSVVLPISPAVGEGAAGLLASRGTGASPEAPSERHGESPSRSLAHSSRGAGRERDAGGVGVPASDGADSLPPDAPARKRAPARDDLPLTDGERARLAALIRAAEPGALIHWTAACKAIGIKAAGVASSLLGRLRVKGYLVFSDSGGGRYVRVARDLAGDRIRSAPDGSRVEHREGVPVPVTICPPRHARGSVQTQFER